MKKNKLIFSIITYLFIWSSFGQNEKIIYTNLNNNVFLFFNKPIQQGIPGNSNFIFEFNKNEGSKIGLLKSQKTTKTTNLLVTTSDGLIYSFILKYNESISNFNYFIDPKEAINYKRVFPEEINDTAIITPSLKVENKQGKTIEIKKNIAAIDSIKSSRDTLNYVTKYCNYVSSKKPFYFKNTIHQNELYFKLININYNKELLYFTFELQNESLIDLNIDYLTFDIVSRSSKKRTTSQAIEVMPYYFYKKPKVLKGNRTVRYVAVFKKFTISKNKALLCAIKENNGERDIDIIISSRQILHPNKIILNQKL